jgi:hypothetical protein
VGKRSWALSAFVTAVLGSLVIAGGETPTQAASSWVAHRLPIPSNAKTNGAGYAGPLVCSTVSSCVALGQTQTPTGVNEDVIEAGGTTGPWTAVVAPLPPGGQQAANLGPNVLACPAAGYCVGTSLYATPTTIAADILQETAGKWSALVLPVPANAVTTGSNWPDVTGIACPGVGNCVIAGSYQTTTGLPQGFIVQQSASGYAASEAPTPVGAGNHGASLDAVACRSSLSCVAVGTYRNAATHTEPLVVAVSAAGLSALQPPLPANAGTNPQAQLVAIACGSSTSCVALGDYQDNSGNSYGVTETGGASSWVDKEVPIPSGANQANPAVSMDTVACTGQAYCLATGRYRLSSRHMGGFVLYDRSGSLTTVPMPTGGNGTQVGSLACWGIFACVGVGTYADSIGAIEGYLLSVSGAVVGWTQAPLPTGAARQPLVSLNGVACPLVGRCIADGVYDATASNVVQLPLILNQ